MSKIQARKRCSCVCQGSGVSYLYRTDGRTISPSHPTHEILAWPEGKDLHDSAISDAVALHLEMEPSVPATIFSLAIQACRSVTFDAFTARYPA